MSVGDKKIVDIGGKTIIEFRTRLWEVAKKMKTKYKTKVDHSTGDVWIGRIL